MSKRTLSRKHVVRIIVSAITVAILAIATPLAVSAWRTQATEAALAYKQAVANHIEQIMNGPPSAKQTVLQDKALLAPIPFGKDLSQEYKDATKLQTDYLPLIESNATFFKEAASANDLQAFTHTLTERLNQKLTSSDLTITDDASLDSAHDYVASMQTKATGYRELAKRLNGYTFPVRYQVEQAAAADSLNKMANTWQEMVEITDTYIDIVVRMRDAQQAGDETSMAVLQPEAEAAKDHTVSRTVELSDAYKTYLSDETQQMKRLMNAIVRDHYLKTVAEQSSRVTSELASVQKQARQ